MSSWEEIDQRHVYKVGAEHDAGEGCNNDESGFEAGIQYVMPMESCDEPTQLMEQIYTQCKDNFTVCRLREV